MPGLHRIVDGAQHAGRPWLVFSNSLATDISLWEPQVRRFAGRYRILRYDLRGHGGSPPTGQRRMDAAALAADLLEVMDSEGIAEAFHVGVSIGALAGIAAAARQPRRFRALWLCNANLATTPASAASLAERAALAGSRGMGALTALTLDKWFGRSTPPAAPELRGRIGAMIERTDPASFAAYATGMQVYDFTSTLASLPLPVTLVAGSADAEIARQFSAQAERLSALRLALIDGAGHLPNAEAPEAFNAMLDRTLANLLVNAG